MADKHQASVGQILLAWTIRPQRNGHPVLAIPKAVQPQHVQANAATLRIRFDDGDLRALDEAFPAPRRKQALDIV